MKKLLSVLLVFGAISSYSHAGVEQLTSIINNQEFQKAVSASEKAYKMAIVSATTGYFQHKFGVEVVFQPTGREIQGGYDECSLFFEVKGKTPNLTVNVDKNLRCSRPQSFNMH